MQYSTRFCVMYYGIDISTSRGNGCSINNSGNGAAFFKGLCNGSICFGLRVHSGWNP